VNPSVADGSVDRELDVGEVEALARAGAGWSTGLEPAAHPGDVEQTSCDRAELVALPPDDWHVTGRCTFGGR
jgi:hypothetical protein